MNQEQYIAAQNAFIKRKLQPSFPEYEIQIVYSDYDESIFVILCAQYENPRLLHFSPSDDTTMYFHDNDGNVFELTPDPEYTLATEQYTQWLNTQEWK
jgi:hypothetical protein